MWTALAENSALLDAVNETASYVRRRDCRGLHALPTKGPLHPLGEVRKPGHRSASGTEEGRPPQL